jgi:hypothetical protein
MGKRLLGFFYAFFQISGMRINHIMFIKEKGKKQNLVIHGCFYKQNQLVAQNEYIEHRMFKQQTEECII